MHAEEAEEEAVCVRVSFECAPLGRKSLEFTKQRKKTKHHMTQTQTLLALLAP